MCRLGPRLLDSPLFHVPRALFPCARAVLPADRSPDRFRAQVHSSLLALLFRVPSPRIPPRSFRRRLPALGFVPLRDITETRPLTRGFPSPRFVPSSGALSLPTSCSALRLAGLLHPAAASRALLVQGLLSRRSHPSSSEGAPPSPLVTLRSPAETDAHAGLPRPRGLSPRRAASRSFGGEPRDRSLPSSSFFSSRSFLLAFSPGLPRALRS